MSEFEELQKIWNTQNGEVMYAINEKALQRKISFKKRAAQRRANTVELGLVSINLVTGSYLIVDTFINKEGVWDYIGGAILYVAAFLMIIFRMARKKKEREFGRSMMDELNHAISNTTSLLQIASMMIYYYLIPVSIYAILKMLFFEASLEKWLLMCGMFILSYLLIRWEKTRKHLPRKRELEKLRTKLIEDENGLQTTP